MMFQEVKSQRHLNQLQKTKIKTNSLILLLIGRFRFEYSKTNGFPQHFVIISAASNRLLIDLRNNM